MMAVNCGWFRKSYSNRKLLCSLCCQCNSALCNHHPLRQLFLPFFRTQGSKGRTIFTPFHQILLQSLQCGLTPRFLSFKLSDLTIAMLPMLLTLQSAMWVMAPTVLNSSTIYTQGHYRNYQTLSRMQAVRSAYLTPCASDKSFLPKLPISCMRRAKGMHRAQQ